VTHRIAQVQRVRSGAAYHKTTAESGLSLFRARADVQPLRELCQSLFT